MDYISIKSVAMTAAVKAAADEVIRELDEIASRFDEEAEFTATVLNTAVCKINALKDTDKLFKEMAAEADKPKEAAAEITQAEKPKEAAAEADKPGDEPTEAQLRELYIDNGLSIREIAALLGKSYSMIQRKLTKLGLIDEKQTLKGIEEAKYKAELGLIDEKQSLKDFDEAKFKAELKRLYIDENKTVKEMEEILNIPKSELYLYLNKYGIIDEKKTLKEMAGKR